MNLKRIRMRLYVVAIIICSAATFAMPSIALSSRVTNPLLIPPLHYAGDPLYRGENFTLYALDRGTWRTGEHCAGGRYPLFIVSVVFDVPDDFVLSEDYLAATLNEPLLRQLAAQHCPAATMVSTAHYFKGRVIGKKGQISDAATAASEGNGYEKAISRMSLEFGSKSGPRLSNDVRGLRGNYSWNDVLAFNTRGLRTEREVDLHQQQRLARQQVIAAEQAKSQARTAWFTAQKAATGWRGRDNWIFEVYLRGHHGIPAAPPRGKADCEAQKYPAGKGDILLAYVEAAHKTCATVSPNGTQPVGFTLTDKQTGLVEKRGTVNVDRRLKEAYTGAKLYQGAYTLLRLNEIARLQRDLEGLFTVWSCDGPEFGRFIEGILKFD